MRIIASHPPASPLTLAEEDLLTRHVDPIHRFFYRWVGNREDAEELTAQTFRSLAGRLDRCSSQEIGAVICAIARTLLAEYWRRYYRQEALPAPDEAGRQDLVGQGELPWPGSRGERIGTELLAALPERDRRV